MSKIKTETGFDYHSFTAGLLAAASGEQYKVTPQVQPKPPRKRIDLPKPQKKIIHKRKITKKPIKKTKKK